MLHRSKLSSFALVLVCFAMVLSISGCGEDEPTAEELVASGWTSFEAEDYEGARRDFEKALEDELATPDISAEAHIGLGWVHGKMLNLQESIASFQSALSLDSQNADAHAGIALAYLADDQYDQAIASAHQALLIDPNYSFTTTGLIAQDLKVVLAESYYYKGEFEEVKRVLDITGEVSPAELLEEIRALSES